MWRRLFGQDQAGDDPRRRLRDAVHFFQALDFYAAYRGLPEEELLERVERDRTAQLDEPLPLGPGADRQAADMLLLLGDGRRVWWRDLECALPGANAYVAALTEWAAVSRGAFAPTAVAETWRGDRGPAEITFTFDGAEHRVVHPARAGDFLEIGILRDINRLLRPGAPRFAVCDNLGMPNFVVALTAAEQRRLQGERGWTFRDDLTS